MGFWTRGRIGACDKLGFDGLLAVSSSVGSAPTARHIWRLRLPVPQSHSCIQHIHREDEARTAVRPIDMALLMIQRADVIFFNDDMTANALPDNPARQGDTQQDEGI